MYVIPLADSPEEEKYLFSFYCVERVLPNFERIYPQDPSLRQVLETVHRSLSGRATLEELKAAAVVAALVNLRIHSVCTAYAPTNTSTMRQRSAYDAAGAVWRLADRQMSNMIGAAALCSAIWAHRAENPD